MGGFRTKNKNKQRRRDEQSDASKTSGYNKEEGMSSFPRNPNQSNKKNTKGAPNTQYTHDPKYLKNDRMISFYSAQGVFGWGTPSSPSPQGSPSKPATYDTSPTVPTRLADRQNFLAHIIKPLNASFRVTANANADFYSSFNSQIAEFTSKPLSLTVDGPSGSVTTRTIQPARAIPFLPLAYQLDVDRKTIRKHPSLTAFHKFLVLHTEIGHVTRQETVSMVPPAVLDVQPHHSVLDMCAAPGSKTTQMLEVVSHVPEGCTEPQGYVVANDVDMRRACMLVHQCKRINSCALLVTNHAGQDFPMPPNCRNDGEGNEGLFDRVLCDVPCTGDGTIRKNPTIFKSWTAQQQLNIHELQVRIGMRGVRVCKVGGLIVYSTCSMSPYENEASVAELLRQCGGALETVDVSTLPDNANVLEKGFVGRPGMTSWKVLDDRAATTHHFKFPEEEFGEEPTEEVIQSRKDKKVAAAAARDKEKQEPPKVPSYDEDVENWTEEKLREFHEANNLFEYKTHGDVPKNLKTAILPSHFPPTAEEVSRFHLERCLRILPQDQDTGGFFVTVLRKLAPIGSVKLKPTAEQEVAHAEKEAAQEAAMAAATTKEVAATKEEKGNGNGHNNKIKKASAAASSNDSDDDDDDAPTAPAPPTASQIGGKKTPTQFQSNQLFVPVTEEAFKPINDFYGIRDSLVGDLDKSGILNQFFARTESARAICFLPKSIVGVMNADVKKRLRIVHSGLQVFEKNTHGRSGCDYRLSFEGLGVVAPYVGARKLLFSKTDFSVVVKHSTEAPGAQIDNRQFSDKLQDELKALGHGCFLAMLEDTKDRPSEKLMVVMWCNHMGLSSHALVFKTDLEGVKSKLVSQNFWVEKELNQELFEVKKKEHEDKTAENRVKMAAETKARRLKDAKEKGEEKKKRSRSEDDPTGKNDGGGEIKKEKKAEGEGEGKGEGEGEGEGELEGEVMAVDEEEKL